MVRYQIIFEGHQVALEKILQEWSGQTEESTKEFMEKNFKVYGCFTISELRKRGKK